MLSDRRALAFLVGFVLSIAGLVTRVPEFAFFGLSVLVFAFVLAVIEWTENPS